LRFDLRAHGKSEGRPEELTLCGGANDVRAASEFLANELGVGSVALIAASFGGGLAVLHAARHPAAVERLALINPLLHYERRFVSALVKCLLRPTTVSNDPYTVCDARYGESADHRGGFGCCR
jgi:pimeloyl-ACP methyl ester carboxylesterase